MKSFHIYLLFLPLVSSTAIAGQFTVSPKIGHQNMGFSAKSAKTVTDISTTDPGENEVIEKKTTNEPLPKRYNNTVVVGLRTTYDLESLSIIGDIDNARYHFNEGFTDVYGLSVLSKVPFYALGSFQTYALGGLSYRWIKTSGGANESGPDFSISTDIEPIEALNLDAGLGAGYKLAESFAVNLEYKYSDTVAADGRYAKSKTNGRTETLGIINTSSRVEFEKLRATIQELSLTANWAI
jgi:opacity protein-like surface antigen